MLAPYEAKATSTDSQTKQITVGPEKRSYILHVPEGLEVDKPAPLMFVFHGGGGSASSMDRSPGMNKLADREGFIVVYPEGTGKRENGPKYWNLGPGTTNADNIAKAKNSDDIGFIKTIISDLSQEYRLDKDRIYAAGMSLGGMFSYRLACEMGDVFAAIAAVASTMDPPQCASAEPINVLHLHGLKDEDVPLSGGKGRLTGNKNVWPSPKLGIEFWRQKNRCSENRTETLNRNGVTCYSYDHCSTGKATEYCLLESHGHAWPGMEQRKWQKWTNTPVNEDFDANIYIWSFFKIHTK